MTPSIRARIESRLEDRVCQVLVLFTFFGDSDTITAFVTTDVWPLHGLTASVLCLPLLTKGPRYS